MTHKVYTLILNEIPQVPVYNVKGEAIGKIKLPAFFAYPIRKDLIRRAFHSAHTARIQPKGRDPLAGKRSTAESWGIGYSVARVPRLETGRAVFAPMTRGGRLTFPPTTLRKIREEINKKEKVLAIISALAASANIEFVKKRGHKMNVDSVPIVFKDEFVNLSTTREVREVLKKVGVWDDVVRAQRRTRIRAGKGKMRGRKYIEPKSFLAVIHSAEAPILRALRNLPGVDVVTPDLLSILHLAPGGVPGRLMIITESALKILENKYTVVKL